MIIIYLFKKGPVSFPVSFYQFFFISDIYLLQYACSTVSFEYVTGKRNSLGKLLVNIRVYYHLENRLERDLLRQGGFLFLSG